jgi:hypothetical protein
MEQLMNTLAKLQKSRLGSTFPGGTIPVFVLVLMIMFSLHLEAQAPPYQVDWVPGNFFVICQDGHPCPLNREQSERVARMMSEALDGIKKMPFRPPQDWGKRVGQGTANDYIELYQREKGLAGAVAACRNKGRGRSDMVVGPDGADPYFNGKDYLIYYFMAHEIFHLSQFGYGFFDQKDCTEVPGWIMEGMATAVGLEVMRQRYPSVAPSTTNDREARQFSGFRHYDEPLPHHYKDHKGVDMLSGNFPLYYTSSFWRHLANAYHQGDYGFLGAYMDRSGRKGDWMSWLRNNIEKDIGADLGMVFAGFLADYAGWGEPGYPGMFYHRKKWLEGAFGGCEKVVLDKNNATGSVELEILPLSGKCIEVRVAALGESGLQEGESAAIQIAAFVMMGAPDSRDGLHLSIAMSNDKDNFHCAKEVKRNGTKQGIGKCVLVPDDGKIRLNGGSIDGRVWNVKVQEKAELINLDVKLPSPISVKSQEKGEDKGELVNIYTASYTPLDVSSSDTDYGGKNPVYARFYFVLDVAELKFNGQKPPSSGAAKKRTVGSFAEGSDPQTTVPMQDTSGRMANSYSLPEQFRPSIPLPAHPLAGTLVDGKLSNIHVGWQLWEGDNSAADVSSVGLFPAIETGNNKYEAHPLSVGETGSFPVSIGGNLSEEVLVGTSMGTLVVDEFTDLVFRASFDGTLCRVKEWKPNKEYCPNPIPVSGKIVKAFAGTRLPGNHMVIERTPGTEMYRKAAEQGLSEWSTSTSESAPPGSGTSTPGTSSGKGESIGECACTCEERDAINHQGEELKARREAGEDVAVGDIMGLMRCSSTCQREYMICILEENEKEKAAETAHQATKPDDCDCSCTALNGLQSRTTELLQGMQSGNSSAMDELQKLGQCMSVCQNELISCAQR